MSTREGGCQCGAVRYRIEGEPLVLAICHCTECQRHTSSAFGMSLIVKAESLTVEGPTKVYTRPTDSGSEIDCHFCPECGVRVYHAPRSKPETRNVKAGTLDDTSWLRPAVQVWTKSKQPWLSLDLPAVEGQP